MGSAVTWSLGVAALLSVLVLTSAQQQRDLTHEDLGNALIALAKDIRENSARLERHELRERQLGEHLKKSMAALDKRLKAQDTALEALGSKLGQVQSSLQQRDERERIQLQRTQEAVDGVRVTLEGWMVRMEALAAAGTGSASGSAEGELRAVRERLDQLAAAASAPPGGTEDLVLASEKLREAATNLVAGEARWRKHGDDSERLIGELRMAVERLQNLQPKDTSNDAFEGEEETPSLGAILDSLEATQRILTDTASNLERDLRNFSPASSDSSNATLHAIAALREDVLKATDVSTTKISSDINAARLETTRGQGALNSALAEIRTDGTKSLEALREVEKVILQTADGVLDTKRRVEYSVQQIIFDTGELVTQKVKELNDSMTNRFDLLSSTILINQTYALTNLSARMEAEISQVWRQIGIMYRELSQSAGTLDRLQSQTESYVNGSITTMTNMSGKVGQLKSSMAEVEDNLNYLLGRLSLVTQEFNMIKAGLGEALDQARTDFVELQEKLQGAVSDAASKRPIRGPLDDNQVAGTSYREE